MLVFPPAAAGAPIVTPWAGRRRGDRRWWRLLGHATSSNRLYLGITSAEGLELSGKTPAPGPRNLLGGLPVTFGESNLDKLAVEREGGEQVLLRLHLRGATRQADKPGQLAETLWPSRDEPSSCYS